MKAWLRWLSRPWPLYVLLVVVLGHQVLRHFIGPSVHSGVISVVMAGGAVIVIWSLIDGLSSFGRPGFRERVRIWIAQRPGRRRHSIGIAMGSAIPVESGQATLLPPLSLESLSQRIFDLDAKLEREVAKARREAKERIKEVEAELRGETRKMRGELLEYSEGGFGLEALGALLILYGEIAQVVVGWGS